MLKRKKPCSLLLTTGLLMLTAIPSKAEELSSPAEAVTLSAELYTEAGDYGGSDTISTTSFALTVDYAVTSRWNVSVTLVPYLYQNETYTDVVLISGQPVHHADSSGNNPHRTPLQATTESQASANAPPTVAPAPPSQSTHGILPDHHMEEEEQNQADQEHNRIVGPTHKSAAAVKLASPATDQGESSTGQPGNTTLTADMVITEQNISQDESASGIGDTTVSVSYLLHAETTAMPGITLHASVKIPTADEDKGLGTGEFDYQLGVSLSKDVDRWTLSAGAGYTILGQPDAYDLDNYLSGYCAISTSVTDRLWISLELAGAGAASAESDSEMSVTAGLGYDLASFGDIALQLSGGLADGSPDYSLSLVYSLYF